jgi:hypothetical protein
MALLEIIFLTSHGAVYGASPAYISFKSSEKAIASFPLVPNGFLSLI